MMFAKSVLAAAAMALACGAAFAADNDNKAHKGFNDMDKNADGKLTRAEAKGNKELLSRWKEADSNNDETGCAFHGNATHHQNMANLMKAQIQAYVPGF